MNINIVLIILVLSLSSVVKAGGVTEAINAAKVAQKETDAVGFEWRDMTNMIEGAEAAAKDGKDLKAIEIANKVVMQAKEALKQAELAKSADPRFASAENLDKLPEVSEKNITDDEDNSKNTEEEEEEEEEEEPDCD